MSTSNREQIPLLPLGVIGGVTCPFVPDFAVCSEEGKYSFRQLATHCGVCFARWDNLKILSTPHFHMDEHGAYMCFFQKVVRNLKTHQRGWEGVPPANISEPAGFFPGGLDPPGRGGVSFRTALRGTPRDLSRKRILGQAHPPPRLCRMFPCRK